MAKMNSVRIGSVPSEASSKGSLNASVPDSIRKAAVEDVEKLSDGPKLGKKGEHLPSAYRTQTGLIRVDH